MSKTITGFHYIPDFLTAAEEYSLVRDVQGLPLMQLHMRGQLTHRRVASYGLAYDGRRRDLAPTHPIPETCADLQRRVALEVGVTVERLRSALVTEYPAGAKIGMHVDNRTYGSIICGVSLLGAGIMTLEHDGRKDKLEILPRSLYVMRDEARWYRHEVVARGHRYSITFRTVASEEA